MRHKIRNLVLAATFAIGVTASGVAAASVFATSPSPTPTSTPQAGESVNDNKDDGEKGQAGVQETGDKVNNNQDGGGSGQTGANQ